MKELPTPARRGDVILTEGTHSYVHVATGTHSHAVYSLGIVTAITRFGIAKKYVQLKDFEHRIQYNAPARKWIAPQSRINVPALIANMRERVKENWNADEFDSIEDARAYLRQFQIS